MQQQYEGQLKFTRSMRLRAAAEFSNLFQKGKRIRGKAVHIVFQKHRNTHQPSQWGVAVGKKLGSAPRRNRLKRLLREQIRLSQQNIPNGYQFVVVVLAAVNQSTDDVFVVDFNETLSRLLKRLGEVL